MIDFTGSHYACCGGIMRNVVDTHYCCGLLCFMLRVIMLAMVVILLAVLDAQYCGISNEKALTVTCCSIASKACLATANV